MNWLATYSNLFNLINDNSDGNTYFSGSKFIKFIQKYNSNIPNYTLYIGERNNKNLSTSRYDYYWDLIKELDDRNKLNFFIEMIFVIKPYKNTQDLENIINAVNLNSVPVNNFNHNIWNAQKLNKILDDIDSSIKLGEFNRTVTLSYTCLEGLYKAYMNKYLPKQSNVTDLIPMSKLVRDDIDQRLKSKGPYPTQMIVCISTLTNVIANSRNSFSESHFDQDANKWIANFARDLLNSVARLILHFV